MKYNNFIMLLQVTSLLMCQSFYTFCAKCWYLPHRWPGPVRSWAHQWALRECRRRDQQRSAEQRLLCRCSGTTLPRHPSRKPLWTPSVALLHHFSARPHPAPQQPGLQHGQSGGAGWAWRGGTGPEGHGRGPDVRPLHRQQYRIPRLSHQPCLMAGRDGPFPVLSLDPGQWLLWGYNITNSQGFLHFFLSLSKTSMFCDFGWRGEGTEEVWLSAPQQWGNNWVEMCSPDKSSDEQLNIAERSVATPYHTISVKTFIIFYFVLTLKIRLAFQ